MHLGEVVYIRKWKAKRCFIYTAISLSLVPGSLWHARGGKLVRNDITLLYEAKLVEEMLLCPVFIEMCLCKTPRAVFLHGWLFMLSPYVSDCL